MGWDCSVLTIPPVVAPYGQEDIQELKSVFEWPHLMENSIFLDTQCTSIFFLPQAGYPDNNSSPVDRIPTVIGNFISSRVYDSKLRTEHKIHTLTCCRFVDVHNGEEVKRGVSWTVCTAVPSTCPSYTLKICPPFRMKAKSEPQYKSPNVTSEKRKTSKSSLLTTLNEMRSRKRSRPRESSGKTRCSTSTRSKGTKKITS